RNQSGLMFGPLSRRGTPIVATRPCSRKYCLTSSVTTISSSGSPDGRRILAHSPPGSGSGGAGLTGLDEHEVRGAIAALDDETTLDIARALARVPAPLGEEGPLAFLVAELLDQPGIDVHVQDVVPGRPNVIATVRGRGGSSPGLLLNAHLDAAVAP